MAQTISISEKQPSMTDDFLPRRWFKDDSSHFVHYTFITDYGVSNRLIKYDSLLNVESSFIDLDSHDNDLFSLGIAYFKNQIIHVSNQIRNDSIHSYYQFIDPKALGKSRNTKFYSQEIGKNRSLNEINAFIVSSKENSLRLIRSVPGKRKESELIQIVEFDSLLQIKELSNYSFGFKKLAFELKSIRYIKNRGFLLLSEVFSDYETHYRLYYLNRERGVRLIDEFVNIPYPTIGVRKDNTPYVILPLSILQNHETNGLEFREYNLDDLSVQHRTQHKFGLEYYLKTHEEEKSKKIVNRFNKGYDLTEGILRFSQILELDDKLFVFSYKHYSSFVFCFNETFNLEWVDKLSSVVASPYVFQSGDKIVYAYSGLEENLLQENKKHGFIIKTIKKNGILDTRRVDKPSDFEGWGLIPIESMDSTQHLFLKFDPKIKLKPSNQYWLLKMTE